MKDGYLVDFQSVETTLKFVDHGIVYDELSEEDKELYEITFENEKGEIPEAISSSALNTWIFNEDTIRKVLHILMTEGIRINYGEQLGKTIIFAKTMTTQRKFMKYFIRNIRICPMITRRSSIIGLNMPKVPLMSFPIPGNSRRLQSLLICWILVSTSQKY